MNIAPVDTVVFGKAWQNCQDSLSEDITLPLCKNNKRKLQEFSRNGFKLIHIFNSMTSQVEGDQSELAGNGSDASADRADWLAMKTAFNEAFSPYVFKMMHDMMQKGVLPKAKPSALDIHFVLTLAMDKRYTACADECKELEAEVSKLKNEIEGHRRTAREHYDDMYKMREEIARMKRDMYRLGQMAGEHMEEYDRVALNRNVPHDVVDPLLVDWFLD